MANELIRMKKTQWVMMFSRFGEKFKISEASFGRYLFYYFKVFGVAPMTLQTNEERDIVNLSLFVNTKIGKAYNIILLILLVTVNIININQVNDYLESHINLTKLELFVGKMSGYFIMFMAIFILLFFTIQPKQAVTTLNKINGIRRSMLHLNRDLYVTNSIVCEMIYAYSTLKVFWLIRIIIGILAVPGLSWHLYSIYISNYLNNLLMLQYVVIVTYLRRSFKFINEELTVISKKTIVDCNAGMRLYKVKQLQNMYTSLYKISLEISNYYAKPIVLCILGAFVACTFSCFQAFKCAKALDSAELNPSQVSKIILILIHVLSYGSVHALPLLILTAAVTKAVEESKKTGELVNRCILNNRNEMIISRLNQFSNYLLHAKVKFTAAKFFSLDQSLIISIISSITTYLVIMLQSERG